MYAKVEQTAIRVLYGRGRHTVACMMNSSTSEWQTFHSFFRQSNNNNSIGVHNSKMLIVTIAISIIFYSHTDDTCTKCDRIKSTRFKFSMFDSAQCLAICILWDRPLFWAREIVEQDKRGCCECFHVAEIGEFQRKLRNTAKIGWISEIHFVDAIKCKSAGKWCLVEFFVWI